VRADRLAGFWGNAAAEAQPIDQEEAEACLVVWDSTEGRGVVVFLAEGDPPLEGTDLGKSSLGHNSGVCGLQRSAEIRAEAILGCRC
jgi:hypothetical protein